MLADIVYDNSGTVYRIRWNPKKQEATSPSPRALTPRRIPSGSQSEEGPRMQSNASIMRHCCRRLKWALRSFLCRLHWQTILRQSNDVKCIYQKMYAPAVSEIPWTDRSSMLKASVNCKKASRGPPWSPAAETCLSPAPTRRNPYGSGTPPSRGRSCGSHYGKTGGYLE